LSEIKEVHQKNGNNGINNVGDNNTFNLYKQPIKYELLSKLCKSFINISLTNSTNMNITELPVELLEKIDYNNLVAHKGLYEDFGMYLTDIEEVVDKSLGDKSIKLIWIIRNFYEQTLLKNSNYTGDQILFDIENELLEHTDLIDSQEYCNEEVKYAVCQAVLYVFEKCQILKKPKK